MDRRNFIKGTFGGIVAGGVIVAATDADIATFASNNRVDSPVDVNPQPELLQPEGVRYGEVLYNINGQPVGIVRSINFHREHTDISRAGDTYATLAPGLGNLTYDVVAIGYTN